MGFLAFLASALYWPGIAGAATTPRWALLALTVPWVLREQSLTVAHQLGGAFLLWATVSLLWADNLYDGINALFILLVLAACFCLGAQTKSLRSVWIGAGLALMLSSAMLTYEWVYWGKIQGLLPGPALGGLFVNRNFVAEAAALVIIAAVAERIWWLVPPLLPALLIPQSRGAMLAVAIALVFHFRHWWKVSLPVGAVALGLFVLWTIDKENYGASERMVIWQSTVNGLTWFGHGLGSYWGTYPQFDLRTIVHDTPEEAHNELLTIAFELGIPGVLLALACAASLAGPLDTARLVLIGIAVQSITQFPLHLPTTAFLGMVAAGYAVRRAPVFRDLIVRSRVANRPRRVGARI